MPENKSQSHKDIYENKQNSERQTRDEEQERRRRAEFLSSSCHTKPYKAESPVWSVEAEGLIKEFSRTKIKSTFIER